MSLFRYRISPTSAFATPLRSDTLYGHLLWRAAERYGSAKVTELIAAFDSDQPPFRLSSAFPAGCLPLPCLPPISRQRFRERFAANGGKALVDALQDYKKFRKLGAINCERLLALNAKPLSMERLFASWQKQPEGFGPLQEQDKTVDQPHNSIDRTSGKVLGEGGLYFGHATWYRPGSSLDVYVETTEPELFETLFSDLQKGGYGADSSTGKGQFTYSRDESFDAGQWSGTTNAELLLSLTAAQSLKEFSGYYQPQVKQGKAWSGFGEKNPFKKPFLALCEGAVLTSRPQGGYLLRNIHSNPDVVQILWPVTLPLQLEVQP